MDSREEPTDLDLIETEKRKNYPRKLDPWSGGEGTRRISLSDQAMTSRPNAKNPAEKMRLIDSI